MKGGPRQSSFLVAPAPIDAFLLHLRPHPLDEGTWQQLKAVTPPLLAYGIAVALGATVFNDRAAALGSSIAVGRPSCPAWTLNPAEQVAAPRPPMAPAPAHGHRRPRPPRPAHRHRPPTAGSSGRSRPA